MVKLEDVRIIRQKIVDLVSEEEHEAAMVSDLLETAQIAGAMGTAAFLRSVISQEAGETMILKKLASQYTSEEQRLAEEEHRRDAEAALQASKRYPY